MNVTATRAYWHGIETVYRLYDGDRLIYVGQTRDLPNRIKTHQRESWWWPYVSRTKVSVFPNRFAARAAEQAAIRDEMPAYNVRVAGLPDRLSKDHWTPKDYAMAERHRRALFLRSGIDPDTFGLVP